MYLGFFVNCHITSYRSDTLKILTGLQYIFSLHSHRIAWSLTLPELGNKQGHLVPQKMSLLNYPTLKAKAMINQNCEDLVTAPMAMGEQNASGWRKTC